MKRFANVLCGIWVVNILMLLAYVTNRPLYEALAHSGMQMYSCIDWDATGHVVPGACADAPPAFGE